MKYSYHPDGVQPESNQIFVFGSNQSGIHGAGAARAAYDYMGAGWGVGEGLTGQCYALPTKDANIQSMTLEAIALAVERFVKIAKMNLTSTFFMTRVGCGLAGYRDEDIAPMFRGAPTNIIFPDNWQVYLEV